jgi:ribosomal protein S7
MKAIVWDEASQGMKFEFRDIPAALLDEAQKWRENMIEAAAEASEGRGGAMKKRDEVHRMAEANKAFSHFRF